MIQIPTLVDKATFDELFNKVAAEAKDGMTFVEIGSFLGGSICYLGQKLKELDKNVKLIAVDNWEFTNISTGHMSLVNQPNYHAQFVENVNKCGLEVESIIGDSIEISKQFNNESIDFIFIDGCHDYPYVEHELVAWLPKMKKNSILSGHDYCSAEGIRKAVKRLLNNVQFVDNQNSYYCIFGKGL